MTRTAPRTGSPLSLHDALPILQLARAGGRGVRRGVRAGVLAGNGAPGRLVAAPAELDRLDLRSAELPRRWRRVVGASGAGPPARRGREEDRGGVATAPARGRHPALPGGGVPRG